MFLKVVLINFLAGDHFPLQDKYVKWSLNAPFSMLGWILLTKTTQWLLLMCFWTTTEKKTASHLERYSQPTCTAWARADIDQQGLQSLAFCILSRGALLLHVLK